MTASVHALENGRDAERRASLGNDRGTMRRKEDGYAMARSASTPDQPKFVAQSTLVGIDEKETAESFSAAVIDFDAYTLARAAGRDVETARLWKAARRAPNSTSLINMGRTIQAVQDWVNGEIESRKPHAPIDANARGRAYALLQQQAIMPGERGAMARALLSQLSKEGF